MDHPLWLQNITIGGVSKEPSVVLHITSSPSPEHLRIIRAPDILQELIDFLRTKEQAVLHWSPLGDSWSCCIERNSAGRSTRTRRLYVTLSNFRFCLTGRTDDQVAQLAAMLWSLPRNKEEDREQCSSVSIHGDGNNFDFSALASEFILPSLLFQQKVAFLNVQMPSHLAVQLASQSQPIDLMLFDSTLANDGKSFLQALAPRQKVGTLTFNACSNMSAEFFYQLYQVKEVNVLRIVTHDRTACTNSLLPFTSQAQKVEYEIVCMNEDWKDGKLITIVTKRFILKMTKDDFGFASIFLRATAKLIEIGLIMTYSFTAETQRNLIAAVDRNQNFQVLEFGPVNGHWSLSTWQDLMDVLGRHASLCKLKLHCHSYPEYLHRDDDWEGIDSLVSVLKTNRNIIEIEVVSERKEKKWMSRLNNNLQINRCFQGSRSLTRATVSERIKLLGEAMLERNDFRMSGLLLSDHVDVLCMLLRCRGDNSTDAA